MRLSVCVLCALIAVRRDGSASGEFTPAGQPLHINDGNFSERDPTEQEPFQARQQVFKRAAEPGFNLKVQVNSELSRQSLSQAVVDVYINYTRTNTAVTGEDGHALLHVPYQAGMPITVVASKDGYICTLLPCNETRMPVFSSLTMSLLALNQGNIWFFENSVLITGKTSDASLQPTIKFPKILLNLTDSSNVTSVEAYLTIPKLLSEGTFQKTFGILESKSGYIGVELSPVAAVSVKLFSGDTEMSVSGPIQISLSLPDNCGLQTSNVVPAWFFNTTTGGWMRKGLGTVLSVEGRLKWAFTAPHLGYWIAAPLSSTRGFFELAIPIEFILQYSSFLMLILGGMLLIVICLLIGLSLHHRSSLRETKTMKILPVSRKDQTTSTCDEQGFGLGESVLEGLDPLQNGSIITFPNGNVIANPSAVSISVEHNKLELNSDLKDVTLLHEVEQIRLPASLTDNLFFYNQPVAILHTPAFFHLEEQPEEQLQCSRSATLPRARASNRVADVPLSRDSFTQTLPKGSPATQSQEIETEDELGGLTGSQAATSTSSTRDHSSLPESMSVPGTLNKISGRRHSVRALAEFSKATSLQPPRAWFVSLEGKPAAEIHYSVSEQQRRRRPVESRETSLDSGVDLNELNQASCRRTVTLERNATFVKSTSGSKHSPPQ